jgi:hypothetical protein
MESGGNEGVLKDYDRKLEDYVEKLYDFGRKLDDYVEKLDDFRLKSMIMGKNSKILDGRLDNY